MYQFLLCGAIILGTNALLAQTRDSLDRDYSADLPRIAPTEPDKALATFEIAPGYKLEQVAAEPLVTSPVAASFDEHGRLYVVEMRDYSEQDKERLGRVRLLTDTDGDGRFDRSEIFAEQLSWPTAIHCYDGGVYVGAAPDLLYLKDTTGDGVADERRVIYTGFGRGNVQGLVNSFMWGLDNRIHVAVSSAGAELVRVDAQGKAVGQSLSLRGRDFAFDPRNPDQFAATSGGGQHGMCFDDWGRKFVSSNSDHIQLIMLDDADLARNPRLVAPSPRISIAADGPQADVYRISPVEPWREIRTRLRKQGITPGIVEGGGRAAGYFTGATGVTIYRGDAWPAADRGLAIVGDVGSNLIHRKRLSPRGLELVAERIDQRSELVASRDNWFRPVQYLNAPDGGLYILDMYREVIEHPASLPPLIKQHLDLTSGRDRGRVYRLVPDDFKQPQLPSLGSAKTAELVQRLEHANGWQRDTAARLLYQQQDRAAVPLLQELATKSRSPLARMHALYALAGMKNIDSQLLVKALADADPRVRLHAVRLARRGDGQQQAVVDQLLVAASDTDRQVRLEAALALGAVRDDPRGSAAMALIRQDGADRWLQAAVGSSFAGQNSALALAIWSDDKLSQRPEIAAWIESLLRQIDGAELARAGRQLSMVLVDIAKHDSAQFSLALRQIASSRNRPLVELIAHALQDSPAKEELAALLLKARGESVDAKLSLAQRLSAIRLLSIAGDDAKESLVSLLTIEQPVEVQLAALETCWSLDRPPLDEIIARLGQLSPAVREQAINRLLSQDATALQLLTAAAGKRLELPPLSAVQWSMLERRSAAVQQQAKQLRPADTRQRQAVIDDYRGTTSLAGDRTRGAELFRKQCATCHKLGDVGHEIGPNLAAMKNRGAEAIVTNVLDPNREVNPQFVTYVVLTKDGRTLSGMIASETANSLILKRAENQTDTVLRGDIEELRGTGLSLMPEGLEKQLDKQQLADLVEFILQQ
ncbi:MAG TPA: PVC-type heme-binding CxxCH protein [Pirellulaceae bacterium]|nr:PVC-type heme-binding CxxCH protein [Pirellulaceae bacterium]